MLNHDRGLLVLGIVVCLVVCGGDGAAVAAAGPRPATGNEQVITTADGTLVTVTITQQGSARVYFDAALGAIQSKLKVSYRDNSCIFDTEPITHKAPWIWPPFAHQAPLLQATLQTALPNPHDHPVWAFSMRLATYPEMSYRVASLAAVSKNWDRRRGRAKTTFTNSLITSLANSQETYGELRELFATLGYQITLQSAEKVLVDRVKMLPYGAELAAQGINPGTPVPFDAILWFRVELKGVAR
jgi:hypothetical protein